MSTTPEQIKELFCLRSDYYRGPESAKAIKHTSRPQDEEGRDIWDRICESVNSAEVDPEMFIDWCFKECLPGLPYLNAIPTNLISAFLGCPNKNIVREGVDLHIELMSQKLDTLLQKEGYHVDDILFDDRFEFHCVFSCILGEQLGLDIPDRVKKNTTYLKKVFPHYHLAVWEKLKR